jgi:hypothetical protein
MQDNLLLQIQDIVKLSKPDGLVTKLSHNTELWNSILEYTDNVEFVNKAERVYFYTHQLKHKPTCKCGQQVSFISIVLGYREFCSRHCTYAKQAALDRRVASMKKNGGVGLANPATYLKAKGKLQTTYGACVTNPGQIKSHRIDMTINNPMFNTDAVNRRNATNMQRYGRINPSTRNIPDNIWTILNNPELFELAITGKTTQQIKDELGLSITNKVLDYIRKNNMLDKIIFQPNSAMEHDLANWLDSKNIPYQQHNRSILSNHMELDFYFPQWNFAIELHGLFHHSELNGGKNKTYHQQKYKECNAKNIQLLQIWQDEYWKHKNVVQSKILYLANMITQKIHARKCKLAIITNVDEERQFMNMHHIQGCADYRQWSLGAWHNNELIAIMSFSDQMNRLELVRYATNTTFVISGLFSKMLQRSIKEFNFSGDILSFSDNRVSNGRLYCNSGFVNVKELNPGYCYTLDFVNRINRQQCMKPKLIKRHNLDPSISDYTTEWQLAQELGYDRIWDAGKIKWIYHV